MGKKSLKEIYSKKKLNGTLSAEFIWRLKPLPLMAVGFALSVHPSPRGEGKQRHCF